MSFSIRRSLLYSVATLALACGDNGLGPANISVNSAPDLFSLQLLNAESATELHSYNWVNNGTQAHIVVIEGITEGGADMTVRDADGTVMHQDDLANGQNADTQVGTPGQWTITIDFQNMSGGFNLTLSRLN